ncbi:MAG: MFS transporter [Oscillospiraceae bacterium]|nr:MFS transporter [Oscillospiraceae bacterium]
MYSLLLAIIYLAFISLGLPDALLGSAWPVIREEMNAPLWFAGIISAIISVGTIISSLMSDRVTKKLGAGLVAAVSILSTVIALFGFSLSGSFIMLCVFAIPYGLGAGAVDAALNNHVALHYKSKHMNWLHCCWGIGASISPLIMSFSLTSGSGWASGYKTVAILQAVLMLVMFAALPLWKNQQAVKNHEQSQSCSEVLKLSQIIRIKGVKYVLPAFFAYCALEQTAGLWASSYLTLQRNIAPETAARYASFFFFGITAGRFLCGFISDKIGGRNMIRIGTGVIITGIIAVWLPVSPDWLCLNGLIAVGFGCAPIFPSVIHETPANFGKENAQAIIGVQMASAYTGITLMPPLFGLIAENISINLYPVYLFIFAALMLLMTEKLNKTVSKNNKNKRS